MIPLDSLPLQTRARLCGIAGEGPFRRRLLEMGLVPGAECVVVAAAPLGDPLRLLIRGTHMSLRRAEVHALLVEPL